MMRTKDVYYKNNLYKISIDELRHVNGYDMVKLPNELYVYYDDLDREWKLASNELIEQYTGKKYIDVEINGETVKALSYLDLHENIGGSTVTKVNIQFIVNYDKEKNLWKLVDKDTDLYKITMKYIQ